MIRNAFHPCRFCSHGWITLSLAGQLLELKILLQGEEQLARNWLPYELNLGEH